MTDMRLPSISTARAAVFPPVAFVLYVDRYHAAVVEGRNVGKNRVSDQEPVGVVTAQQRVGLFRRQRIVFFIRADPSRGTRPARPERIPGIRGVGSSLRSFEVR